MEVWLVSHSVSLTPLPSVLLLQTKLHPHHHPNHQSNNNNPNSKTKVGRSSSNSRERERERDMRIDFGRYQGKMLLGSLPSAYLKWVSTNLRARDYKHWVNLSSQVLADLFYRDRIEWEFAHNLLNGNNVLSSSSDGGKVSELLADISERFGWDTDDKLGWNKIDFALAGPSKGGRKPRITATRRTVSPSLDKATKIPNKTTEEEEEVLLIKKETVTEISSEDAGNNGVDSSSNRRSDRTERLWMKRSFESGEKEKTRTGLGLRGFGFGFGGVDEDEDTTGGDDHVMIKDNHPITTRPFPGRDLLLLLNKIRHSSASTTRRNKGQSPHPEK